MSTTIRVGTRGSRLALVQADIVIGLLGERLGLDARTEVITTSGDRESASSTTTRPPQAGAFVKEIERALLEDRIDVAVHSYKDLPTELPPGLVIAAVPVRARPEDVLVFAEREDLERVRDSLASGFGVPDLRIGTGSPRRSHQLVHAIDCEMVPIRGNVTTRLSRIEDVRRHRDVDAICIARAGIERLGIEPAHVLELPIGRFPTAAGQGAIALETRKGTELESRIAELDDPDARLTSESERAFLREIDAGCLTPVGTHASVSGGRIHLLAEVFLPGDRRFRTTVEMVAPFLAGEVAGKRYQRWL